MGTNIMVIASFGNGQRESLKSSLPGRLVVFMGFLGRDGGGFVFVYFAWFAVTFRPHDRSDHAVVSGFWERDGPEIFESMNLRLPNQITRANVGLHLGLLLATAITTAIWLLRNGPSDVGGRVFQGKTLAAWFDQMQGYNRDPGVQTLRDIGSDSVVYLARQVNRKDSFLRAQYVALWPKLPGFLKSKLKRPKSAAAIRMQAIGTLREMGPPFTTSDIGLATLTAALNHPDIEVRSRAEGAVGDTGPPAKAAVPALIKSVEQRGPTATGHIDINGIWALGRIGPDAKSAIPLLESIVKEKGGRELVYAAEALMKVSGDSSTAIAALEKALEDQDREARTEAAEALRNARLTLPVATKERDSR